MQSGRWQQIRGPMLGLLMAITVGCGSSNDSKQPPLYPTAGIVTLDGKPLAGASVGFVPTGTTAGQSSSATTGPGGTFSLETSLPTGMAPGTAAGDYKVIISRQLTTSDPATASDPANAPAAVDGQETLPSQYSDFLNSALTATVPDGGVQDLKFDLKSK